LPKIHETKRRTSINFGIKYKDMGFFRQLKLYLYITH
jgi:hypothetical protein